MSETNKSYRVRSNVGIESGFIEIDENLVQEYDTFEVLSVKINSSDSYRLHNSNHGILVGRVIANNGFGIPNAKVSIFIEVENGENFEITSLYPYFSSVSTDKNGVRYNLLPNERVNGCHQVVGTFPNKRYALDNDVILEVFDKYYKYTTKTNNSGDYLICGIPVGSHTLHMDLDLSDCGLLSQKPRDFVYKGYTVEQFESPTKFKNGTDYRNLSQIFTQDQVVDIKPFWGNESLDQPIGITRADINVNFKFETTCIFMGSIFSDNSSNGFSQKCIPTPSMGEMSELVTAEGKIEMIRKTPGGNIEEIQIKGKKLINSDGVWCYQIPMNLDYMVTDEYGNLVPTDNPETGIATRACVRFRISMEDHEENTENFFRAKVLVPNNPQNLENHNYGKIDYEFGSETTDDSFRDLFMNNVYSVKSYIPRIQKSKTFKSEKFSGIKRCNDFGPNNPMPYNNIRIKLPFMFTVMCAIIKCFIHLTKGVNFVILVIGKILSWFGKLKWGYLYYPIYALLDFLGSDVGDGCIFKNLNTSVKRLKLITLKDGLCPDLENWYFSPLPTKSNGELWGPVENMLKQVILDCNNSDDQQTPDDDDGVGNPYSGSNYDILRQTLAASIDEGSVDDIQSIDDQNEDDDDSGTCITVFTDYLISCVEMNLAQEYKVINFDFYNDWINGTIYNPRWVRYIKPKTKFLWITWASEKVKGCMDNPIIFSKTRRYTQQCSIGYERTTLNGKYDAINEVKAPNLSTRKQIIKSNSLHKKNGIVHKYILGKNGGICHQHTNMKGQYVYYLKPCEWVGNNLRKVNLFATDIILLGSFNDCDYNGVPVTFTHLTSSTYLMPTNLALTNMDSNGPLYAKNDGTFCLGSSTNNMSGSTSKVTVLDGSKLTLKNEIEYYGRTQNSSLEENDADLDTIAMTEAAGISWNYTGPGQGSVSKENMYYPGGHFLGISCVNAETNLKSCINLSRICEIGTNMSQRKEDVMGLENGVLKYKYSVPSGFISGDEVSDVDFRSMFSTLNKKRLIATKRNPDTGYRFYDFDFSMPINFNGSFSSIVNISQSPYNQKINVSDEDLTSYGINSSSERMDNDPDEHQNTQVRTREKADLDYYLFRFGITYDKVNDFSAHENKFLIRPEDGDDYTEYYLPQYENSFYFYFGLRQGATAIDEFNKQFYSECDNLMIKKVPNMILTGDVNFCEAKGKINVITEGLTTPYQSITIYKSGQQEPITVIDGTNQAHIACLTNEVFELVRKENNSTYTPWFELGKYTVTIVDSDDVEITRDIELGVDLISYDTDKVDFNLPIGEYPSGATITNVSNSIYRGGYMQILNLNIDGFNLSDFSILRFKIIENASNVNNYSYQSDYVSNQAILYCKNKDTRYDLFIEYKCNNSSNINRIYLENFTVKDNSNVQLMLGNENYSIKCIDGNDGVISGNSETWWWDDSHMNIGGIDTNNDNKWFYKAMFFNRNKGRNPFNSNVFATGGRKIIWGTPQNTLGFSNMKCACSENEFAITPGFSLDDSNSYFSTYGTDNCLVLEDNEHGILKSGSPDVYTNCVMQYCAQAYNGSKACGKYHGTYSRQNGVNFTENDKKYYKEGYGCVFKPLPHGRLSFIIYSGDTTSMNNAISELDCEYGVFYPTFIYPVIKRPFYINSTYIKYGDRDIYLESNAPVERYVEKGYSVVAEMNNGVTYNKKFDESSYITGTNWSGNDSVSQYDWYGLTEANSTNRVETVSGFSESEIIEPSVSYLIKEGFNGSVMEQFTKTHELSVSPSFTKRLGFSTKIVSGITCIGKVIPMDMVDNRIQYYLGVLTEKSSKLEFLMNTNDFLYKENQQMHDVFYALCRFIKGDGYAVQINDGMEFSEVIVTINITALNQNGSNQQGSSVINIKYDYINGIGENETYNEDVNFYGNHAGESIIDSILGSLSDHNKYNQPLSPVRKIDILRVPKYNGSDITWKQAVERLIGYCKSDEYYSNNNIAVPDFNNNILFGLGVFNYTENGNNTKIYKIYKDLTKTDEEYSVWGDGNGDIYLSETELNAEAKHTDYSITISASSPTTVSLDLSAIPTWVNIGGGGRIVGNKLFYDFMRPVVYTINIGIKHNNFSTPRSFVLNFSGNGGNIEHVYINQSGATGTRKTITLSEETENSNYNIDLHFLNVNIRGGGFMENECASFSYGFKSTGTVYDAQTQTSEYAIDFDDESWILNYNYRKSMTNSVQEPYRIQSIEYYGRGSVSLDNNKCVLTDANVNNPIDIVITR